MPQKDKPKDLTPEERLFKLIQEGEKAEDKDDTLIVSSDAGLSKPIVFEEGSASGDEAASLEAPSGGLSAGEIREKKAVRAGLMKRYTVPSFSMGSVQNVLSLRTLNRVLTASFLIVLIYFVASHAMTKSSVGGDFMQKANAMAPASVADIPSNLFSVRIDPGSVPERNVFQPYKPPTPKPVEAPAAAPVSNAGALDGALSNFKLTGIYMGEIPEALVETNDEQKTYAIKEGSELRGVKVKAVKPEGILFTDGQSEQLLR